MSRSTLMSLVNWLAHSGAPRSFESWGQAWSRWPSGCVSQVGPLVARASQPAGGAAAAQPTARPPVATPVPLQEVAIELGARSGSGWQYTRRHVDVSMQANQRLQGSFIIVNEFGVLDPFGVLHDSRKVGAQGSISFVARDAGVRRLLLDNTYSLWMSKTVSVRWGVLWP